MNAFPEVTIGAYVLNARGELLLIKSPKWHNDWMPPGGHLEYGETIKKCAEREVMEETGLKVRPLGVISIGEGIFPKEYHSKRHFIYVEVLCRAITGRVRIDGTEAIDSVWIAPEAAIAKTKNRAVKRVIRIYLKKRGEGFSFLLG